MREECSLLKNSIKEIILDIEEDNWQHAHQVAKSAGDLIHEKVRPFRAEVARRMANSELDANTGTSNLEAVRWLRRVSRHITRITQHTYASLTVVEKTDKEII